MKGKPGEPECRFSATIAAMLDFLRIDFVRDQCPQKPSVTAPASKPFGLADPTGNVNADSADTTNSHPGWPISKCLILWWAHKDSNLGPAD